MELPDPQPFAVTTNPLDMTRGQPPATGRRPVGDQPNLQYYYSPPLGSVPDIGIAGDPNYWAGNSLSPPPRRPPASPPAVARASDSSATGSTAGQAAGTNVDGIRRMPDPAASPTCPRRSIYSSGTKAGWYKVLEFLEVPSNSLGYIGPVAAGQNADWARQRPPRPGR